MAEEATLRIYRGTRESGAMVDYTVPRRPAWSCSTRSTRAGPARAGSGRALELQGGQVRLVQRRSQRQAAADVHGPDGQVSPRRADHRPADEDVPGDQGSGLRRLLELRGQQEDPAVQAARQDADWTLLRRKRRTGCRSSASASSASCARTSATCCATTRQTDRFGGPASSSASRAWRCIRSTTTDRTDILRDELGIGLCNITKCCTEVCPEHITITDNAIIPLKERVVDRFYDPVKMAWRFLRGGSSSSGAGKELPVLPSGPGGMTAARRPRPSPSRHRSRRASRRPSPRASRRRPRLTPRPPRPRVPPDLPRPHRRPGRPADAVDRR